jgi:glycerol uptake facilitator-like aquaporin
MVGKAKEKSMKTFALWLLLVFMVFALASCSGMTITEKFDKTPATASSSYSAKTKGEGRSTFSFTYRGEKFIVIKGSDGKYYVIGKDLSDANNRP